MQDRQALFDFIDSAKARYDAVLEPLRAHAATQDRGMPMAELMHNFGNMSDIHSARNAADAITRLETMSPTSAEHTADAIQRRVVRFQSDIYRRLTLFAGEADMRAMRMRPWENKVDFDAIGWQGEKPSEAVEGLGASIQTFFSEHPALVEQLKASDAARTAEIMGRS